MRKLGIGYYLNSAATDMAYGSSNGTTVANATSPDLLVEGSIGIYGDLADGTGLQILPYNATLSNYTSFMIYQGGKNETILLSQFLGSELQTINSAAYLSPIKQVAYLGYNGISGDLNNITTIAGDSAQIQLNQRMLSNNPIATYFAIGDSGKLAAAATGYNILLPAVIQLNNTRGTNAPKGKFEITNSGTSQVATGGTATGILFTKGSTTATFYIQDTTSGWVASTGTVAAADVISVPSSSVQSFSFVAPARTSASSDVNVITINGTIYVTGMTSATAATNAAAVIAKINAGTQAYAYLSSTSTVNVVLLPSLYAATISVDEYNGTNWTSAVIAVTRNTTGETTPVIYKATAAVIAGATFTLDYPYQGDTAIILTSTVRATTTGILTAGTAYGVKFTANNYFEQFTLQTNGVLVNATLTYNLLSYALPATSGSGEFSEERLLENYGRYYRGANDTYSAVSTSPKTYYTKEGKGYDNYSIVIKPMRVDGSGLNATSSNQYTLDMGFEHFNLTTNLTSAVDNQYVFEQILNLFVTAYPNLAYTKLVS